MKKSDKYIFEEADYIKRAIEDEQAIQMLKDEISDDVKVLFLTHPLFFMGKETQKIIQDVKPYT